MNLLFGHDKIVADWVSKQTGNSLSYWNHAVGVLSKDGLLVGCGSFHEFNGSNIEFCFYGPRAVTATIMRGFMRFAFVDIGANRVTARTPRQNRIVIKHLPRIGFKMEGVMKHYYGPVKRLDAIVFGLLKADLQ